MLLDQYRILQNDLLNNPDTYDAWIASIKSVLDENVKCYHTPSQLIKSDNAELAQKIIDRIIGRA